MFSLIISIIAIALVAALAGNDYMKEVPSVRENAWTIATNADEARLSLVGSDYDLVEVCEAINEEAGEANPKAVTTIAGQFGCETSGSVAVYKL